MTDAPCRRCSRTGVPMDEREPGYCVACAIGRRLAPLGRMPGDDEADVSGAGYGSTLPKGYAAQG